MLLQEVEDTDEAAIYERATWDRLPLNTWCAAGGHVVLLGDAAHAMYSGAQGLAKQGSHSAVARRCAVLGGM